MIGQNNRFQEPKDPHMGGKVTLDPSVIGKDRLHSSFGQHDSGLREDRLDDPRESYLPKTTSRREPQGSRGPVDPEVLGRKDFMIPPELNDKGDKIQPVMMTTTNYEPEPEFSTTTTQEHPGYWVRGTHYNKDGSKSGKTRKTPQEIVDAGGEPGYKTTANPNQTYTGDTTKTTTTKTGTQDTDNYLAMRDKLMNNLTNPELAQGVEQEYTSISAGGGESINSNDSKFRVSAPSSTGAETMEAKEAAATAKLDAESAEAKGYTAVKAQAAEIKATMEAEIATAGQASPVTVAKYQAAQAAIASAAQATKGYVSKLAQGAEIHTTNAEAAYQRLDEIDPKALVESVTHEVPNSATVKGQLDDLLGSLENNEIPVWARPAVAAAESQMSARGMSSSSVGRNALYNAIITSAMPIAQQDAKAKLSVFQQDITNEQQAILANSQFFQTLTVKNLDNKQQAAIVNATNATNASIAEAQNMTQASIANAKNFLQMDIANMTNEQQTNIVNAQLKQQAMLSNQAAENAAKQFNASSENQANQFNANLASSIDQFNISQKNSMSQFNTSQVNDLAKTQANLENQMNLANQQATNRALEFSTQVDVDVSKFNVAQDLEAQKISAQLEQQLNIANTQAHNAASQFNAAQQNSMAQFNSQQKLAAEQFNAQNATAIEQSNAQWRREMNKMNTAGKNAVNQANAMNKFNLNNQALTFLWQEQRDAAKWENDAAENDEERKTRLALAALGNESAADASTLSNIKNLAGAAAALFDSWGD